MRYLIITLLFLCSRRYLRLGFLLTVVATLNGCSLINPKWFDHSSLERQVDEAHTLGALPAASEDFKQWQQESVLSASTDEKALLQSVSIAYQEALLLADEPLVRQEIQRRLAHINLQLAEERQMTDATTKPKEIYQRAINAYVDLLDNASNQESLDQILYPLAKAYEMSGDNLKALATFNRLVSEAPNSNYIGEVQFRRAEILFARAEYAPASKAYKAVIQHSKNKEDNDSSFLMNSLYMAGWSDFKLGHYSSALHAFFTVLDNHYKPIKNENLLPGKQALTQNNLLNDTLRVMGLAFSYEAGATSIGDMLDHLYSDSAEPHYVDELYDNLADLYLEKKRFIDSANTFSSYIDRYPQSVSAPIFHERIISVYLEGGFPDRVREQKIKYVKSYNVQSDYWTLADDINQLMIQKKLIVYINELASYYHNLAQVQQHKNKQLSDKAQAKKYEIKALYKKAAYWYEVWLENSPYASENNQILFLLGETRYQSEDYSLAIKAYENAAYKNAALDSSMSQDAVRFTDHNEAAYAALLAYDRLIEKQVIADALKANKIKTDKNKSALLFANTFVDDKRTNAVLVQTAQSLFSLNHYEQAIEVGQQLIGRLDKADEHLEDDGAVEDNEQFLVIAYLTIAHAQQALQRYDLAEQAYAQVLTMLSKDDNTSLYQQYYAATLDNYAASIYQQGVVQIKAEQPSLAADSFMRVVKLAPVSSIRVSAQRDAIALFMQTQQWRRAITAMTDFQLNFGDDDAAKVIPAQLLLAYESLKSWPEAAAQAKEIAKDDHRPEVRQQALYSAAELYEKAGDLDGAIESYRSYAHSYPEPLATNMEAQYRLTVLYAKLDEVDKRGYWLRKLIASHNAAKPSTNRSRYLAAFSAIDLAEQQLLIYQKIILQHPLKKSLARKRKAMQHALDAYYRAANYDIEAFSTQATYRIAGIYAGLASALLESERPSGLNALELEQYDFLLEEQALPFEEKAIEFYTINVERSWQGIKTDWIKYSYQALAKLMPARFDKREMIPAEG